MSSLIRQSHATNKSPFWLSANTKTLSLNTLSVETITDVSSIAFKPDNNVLTVSADVLYLDGMPVVQNVSGAEHWAVFPASTSVDLSFNSLYNVASVDFSGGDVLNVSGGEILVNGLPLAPWYDVSAQGNVNLSGFNIGGVANISLATINGLAPGAAWYTVSAEGNVNLSGFDIVNVSGLGFRDGDVLTASGGLLYVNGIAVDTSGNASNWSTYPATSTVDLDTQSIVSGGGLQFGGVLNTAQFGTGPFPMLAYNVRATDVDIIGYNPVAPLGITGAGGVAITSAKDIDINGDDVNIAAVGLTNILNITAAAGVAINAGAGVEIGAVGTIQILSTGNVSIGSGNVLGADTEIEKFAFNDEVMSKAGVSDLELEDIGKINGTSYIATQNWSTTHAVSTVDCGIPVPIIGTVRQSIINVSDINLVSINGVPYAPGVAWYTVSAQSSVDFNNNTLIDVSGIAGNANFTSIPSTAGTPSVSSNLTTKAYVDGLVSFKDTTDFYVSEQGSDITGNGSILRPYATVQKAITEAEAISSSANICVIHIASGHYTGNLTFSNGYVILVGAVSSQTGVEITEITGSITINLTVGGNDLFNKQVGFVGLNITGGITDTSTLSHTVFMQDCQVFADNRLFYVNSTAPDQRTYLTNVDFNQDTGTLTVVEINNGRCQLERVDIATDNNVECLRISGDCVLERLVLCSLENANASATIAPLVRITSSTTTPHNIGQTSFVYNTAVARIASPDSCAVLMDTGAVNPVMNFQFNFISLLGTADGFNVAVGKTAGMTGVPTILYGTNNCLPNALGSCTTIENTFVSVPLTPLTNSNINITALNVLSLSAATITMPSLTVSNTITLSGNALTISAGRLTDAGNRVGYISDYPNIYGIMNYGSPVSNAISNAAYTQLDPLGWTYSFDMSLVGQFAVVDIQFTGQGANDDIIYYAEASNVATASNYVGQLTSSTQPIYSPNPSTIGGVNYNTVRIMEYFDFAGSSVGDAMELKVYARAGSGTHTITGQLAAQIRPSQ